MTTIELKDGTRLVVKNGKIVLKKSTNAFPFLAILCLIFVIAKLTGHFNYSWWTVFSPIWVGPALAFGCLGTIIALVLGVGVIVVVCVFAFFALQAVWEAWKRRKARNRPRNTIIER